MAKYKLKKTIVEAEQFWPFEDEWPEGVVKFTVELENEYICDQCGYNVPDHGWINILEGGLVVCPGDMVITYLNGLKYPCKPEVFAMTHEKVE